MPRASLLGVVVLVGAAASAAAVPRQPAFDEAELVSGTALTLEEAATPFTIPSADDAFELDPDMRDFVAPLLAVHDPRQRLHGLIRSLEEHGMFSLDYAETTRTASATFHGRQGNCLSFTMLFIGLARAAGLTATYQSVEVPPTWSNDGQVVIASHVNAVVRTGRGQETIVDFNIRSARADTRSRRVNDQYALALFYVNLGAEALLREEHAASLAYLREAAAVYPDIAGLWVNLGVLYARYGRYEHAEAAYLRALQVDEEEESALANLVLVYEALGEQALARQYRDRVQSYRERNPYYHYALASRAYEQQQFADVLLSLRKALRLKHDEHEFYTLRGQALTALGRPRDAEHSFEQAREFEAIEYARRGASVQLEGLDP
ncbi:MAG TPA: tetratricopeptide repeat protein [Gammaproteobacteria bacterium]|nr:tetratricopeptide repeat protein [Gammaproteobacteria bacterium]